MKSRIGLIFCLGWIAPTAFAGSVSDVCLRVANYDSSMAIKCNGLIGNNYFDSFAVDVCAKILDTDYSQAVSCVGTISNQRYDDLQSLPICERIASMDTSAALSCLLFSAGKIYPNNSAAVCAKILDTDYQGAIACLKDSGEPGPVVPACPTGADLMASLKTALQALDQYDITSARKSLVQILSEVEDCQQTNVRTKGTP